MMHRLTAVLAIVAAAMIALPKAGLSAPTQAAQSTAHAAVGTPAPDFSLTTLAGQHIHLNDFRGQPLIINFTASWCAPCRAEAPQVRRLAAQAKARGYKILGIAFHDARASFVPFMQDEGLTFPAALDTDAKVSRAYWLMGPPATFFISDDGVIRYKVTGPLTATDVRKGLARVARHTKAK